LTSCVVPIDTVDFFRFFHDFIELIMSCSTVYWKRGITPG
jgi:hypothetical protein